MYTFIVGLEWTLFMFNAGQTLRESFSIVCKLYSYYAHIMNTFVISMTVVFAIDRVYAAIRPTRAEASFTNRHPRRICALIALAILLLNTSDFILVPSTYNPE